MRQLKLIIAALFLMSAFAANADLILDQSNAVGNTSFCAGLLSSGDCNWQQEVIAGVNGTLVGIDLFANNNGFLALNIWASGSPWQSSAPTSILGVTMVIGQNYIDLSGLGIQLFSGNSFTFGVDRFATANLRGSNDFRYSGNLGLRGANCYDNCQFDLAFNTYVETSAVPEPGTLALLGIGLFGMGLSRRRKKI